MRRLCHRGQPGKARGRAAVSIRTNVVSCLIGVRSLQLVPRERQGRRDVPRSQSEINPFDKFRALGTRAMNVPKPPASKPGSANPRHRWLSDSTPFSSLTI